jgi:hypothetical protein
MVNCFKKMVNFKELHAISRSVSIEKLVFLYGVKFILIGE